jgi:hypothetical protein
MKEQPERDLTQIRTISDKDELLGVCRTPLPPTFNAPKSTLRPPHQQKGNVRGWTQGKDFFSTGEVK